jgi:hypothetical protein
VAAGLDQAHGVQLVRKAVDVPLGVPEPPGHQDDREVERHAVRQSAVPPLVNDIEREAVQGIVQPDHAHLQGQAVPQGRSRLTGQPRTDSRGRSGGEHPDGRRRRFDGPGRGNRFDGLHLFSGDGGRTATEGSTRTGKKTQNRVRIVIRHYA